MSAFGSFRIEWPDGAAATGAAPSGVVFSSPHSGRSYPDALIGRSRLTGAQLRRSEDAYVERLFDAAPQFGAPLIHALAPRAWVDLNRGPEELDPALISGVRGVGLNPRLAAGLGVIPRVVAEGVAIYDGKLTRDEALARLRDHYGPYHDALGALLEKTRVRRGAAVLIDCHSMPSDALRGAPRSGGRRPEIVLGDRFGAACGAWLTDRAEAAFRDAGFAVSRNAPFAGGFITQKYGRPGRGVHALQIEIDRGLYLDETLIEPGPGFAALRAALRPVIAELCGAASAASRPLAAE